MCASDPMTLLWRELRLLWLHATPECPRKYGIPTNRGWHSESFIFSPFLKTFLAIHQNIANRMQRDCSCLGLVWLLQTWEKKLFVPFACLVNLVAFVLVHLLPLFNAFLFVSSLLPLPVCRIYPYSLSALPPSVSQNQMCDHCLVHWPRPTALGLALSCFIKSLDRQHWPWSLLEDDNIL